MAGFNLMGLMNQASKTEAGLPKYELKRLDIHQLYPDPTNQAVYSVENIEELADAIEIAGGVLHNLVVRAEDETGKHMIISGERRWTACNLLVKERGLAQYSEVNCLIENEHDQDMLDLMLMLTNSTARQLSDAEKMRQAERMTEILNRMKETTGIEGRVRDIVGKMLQMSSGQLARYHAIAKNLQNEDLKEAFHDGRLGVSAAYEASKLSEDGQQSVAKEMEVAGKVSLQHVTIVRQEEKRDTPEWKEKMERVAAHREQQQELFTEKLQERVKREIAFRWLIIRKIDEVWRQLGHEDTSQARTDAMNYLMMRQRQIQSEISEWQEKTE